MASPEHTDPRATLRSGLPDCYLTPEDLAVMFKLPSVETLYAWRRKGIGPTGFRVGKYVRYDPTAVREWVARQTALPDTA
ncbi:helix-turn-helix domain-containing protein [Streptomyces sp. NBC_00201]|uniref:helix-turn-helix domain-containing protein n=1 Tax=Streptomyces sp. NBC_00201 TaxID=2975679 RepID=UPI00225266CE|nr:helix-turn-helix domain-containing protein [Streptomyces sp. NBC_00201]MCX5246984.1 helix-turn-helix domain-containing protein [Streptomyces sp. NBC_00201]